MQVYWMLHGVMCILDGCECEFSSTEPSAKVQSISMFSRPVEGSRISQSTLLVVELQLSWASYRTIRPVETRSDLLSESNLRAVASFQFE